LCVTEILCGVGQTQQISSTTDRLINKNLNSQEWTERFPISVHYFQIQNSVTFYSSPGTCGGTYHWSLLTASTRPHHLVSQYLSLPPAHTMQSFPYAVGLNKGARRAGLPRPKQPLHPNRAIARPPPSSTAHPLTVLVNTSIRHSTPPPSSPLPSPPRSPSPKRSKRSSTPPPVLSLDFHTPVVVNSPSQPLTPPPLSDISSPLVLSSPAPPPILALPLTPPSIPNPPPITTPVTPQPIPPSPFPKYSNHEREWLLAEILERCGSYAEYLHYRPGGYTGLVKSWERLDAAMRHRHHRHEEEGWERAFIVAHRTKRREAVE
jgi:hypothetical protein